MNQNTCIALTNKLQTAESTLTTVDKEPSKQAEKGPKDRVMTSLGWTAHKGDTFEYLILEVSFTKGYKSFCFDRLKPLGRIKF